MTDYDYDVFGMIAEKVYDKAHDEDVTREDALAEIKDCLQNVYSAAVRNTRAGSRARREDVGNA